MRALLLALLAGAPADAPAWRALQAKADALALELGSAPAEAEPLRPGAPPEPSEAARRAAQASAQGVRVFFCATTGRWAAEPTGALRALDLAPEAADAEALAWSERFGEARCPWPTGDAESLRRVIRWDTVFSLRFPGGRRAAQARAESEASRAALGRMNDPTCHCHP